MTDISALTSPPKTLAASNLVATELRETVVLSAPIALTQLGQIAMMTTDLALIGRLGDGAVAAAALAHTVFFVVFTVGMGIVSAVAPLAAQAFGARDPRNVRRALRVGLWATLMVCIPMTVLPLFGEQILVALGQTTDSAAKAQTYLSGLAGGLIPALWFMATRNFMGAVNRPGPGLWITLFAIPANALIGWLLIYGHFGMPKLELLGAGLATTIVNIGMCAAGFWFAAKRTPFRKYHVFGRLWRIDWALMKQLFIVGTPISLSFLLEYGMFAAAALLMGMIGTTALAAHQIALQIVAVVFMVPFGIGMAATVRVGQSVGRNDAEGVRRAGYVALALGIAVVTFAMVALIIWRTELAQSFFGDGAEATVALTASLLTIGTTFLIADAIQSIAAGALRGLNDTRIPLLLCAASYWLIGFPAAALLAFQAGFGAPGVWYGLSLGTGVYAISLLTRFYLLTKDATNGRLAATGPDLNALGNAAKVS